MSATADALLRHCRKLFLRGLTRQVRIGVHAFERTQPQRLVFDIELYVALSGTTPLRDQITEVVDYDFVRQVVSQVIERGHIDLQETLGDAVLDGLLAHPQVLAAQVCTYKPDVYEDCAAVGVSTFRQKNSALLSNLP